MVFSRLPLIPALSLALVVAACSKGAELRHDPSGELATCPAPAFQEFVGQNYAHTLFQWSNLRIIRPGDAVTKDYRPDRLNIDLDAGEMITRVYCG